jgi:hypothetical protein
MDFPHKWSIRVIKQDRISVTEEIIGLTENGYARMKVTRFRELYFFLDFLSHIKIKWWSC